MKKLLPLILLMGVFSLSAKTKQPAEKISFSTRTNITPYFIGAGVQWSAYPHADSEDAEWGFLMTDAKWDEVFRRLDYMKPRFARVADQANWRYFKTLDAEGVPLLEFDNQEIRSLYKILDYCQKNNIVVMLGEWGVPGHKHDLDKPQIRLRDALDTRWHGMIAEWVDHLLNVKGYTCIKYYDFINEPNGNWACTAGNFAEWALGARMLNDRFIEKGLTDKITICGPGSVPNANSAGFKHWPGYIWTDLASEVVGDILGAYNTHAYFPHYTARDGSAAEYMFFEKDVAIAHGEGKPFFLGEIGFKPGKDGGELDAEHKRRVVADGYASEDSNMFTYDYFYGLDMASGAIQSMNAGVDAMAAWDLDDAMHTKDDTADIKRMKRWGFWNILGTELHDRPWDEEIRPWYWAWSWLGRYLPPGSKVFEIPRSTYKGIEILAADNTSGYTFAIVNNSDQDRSIELQSSEVGLLQNLTKLVYNEKFADRVLPYDQEKVKKLDLHKGAVVELPAQTFIVITTMKP